MSTILELLNKVQEYESSKNGRNQKLADIEAISTQIAETESALEKMKAYRSQIENEAKTLTGNEEILREQTLELLKESKKEYETQKVQIETGLADCTEATVSHLQEMIVEEGSTVRRLNMVEERIGLEKTLIPERIITLRPATQADVCESSN